MSITGMIRHPEAPPGVVNDETSVDLRQRSVNAAYLVRMEGTVDVAGGTGAGTVPEDSLYRFLRRIALNAADFDFQSVTGRALFLEHAFLNLSPWPQTPIANLAAGASNDIVANFLLPGQMLWTMTPDEFGIPTQLLDSPRLVMNLLDAEEMAIGTDGALSFSSGPEFTVYEIPYLELAERGISPAQFLGVRRKTVTRAITQEGPAQVVLSHLGAGHDLRAVIVNALEADADGDYNPSDTLVTEVRGPILGGVPKFETTPWDVLQDRNVSAYQLAAVQSGAVVIDSAEDKRTDPGQLWKIPAVREDPVLELETAAPSANGARVEVTTISVKRGRGSAASNGSEGRGNGRGRP